MPMQILMPQLTPAMGDGTLTRWLVGEGERVTPGMVIAEIATATATMEVEAVVAGTIARIFVAEGTGQLKAAAPLAELTLAGESEGADIRVPISPLARRLAREKGIDLTAVRGSGPNGRIVKRDIAAAAAAVADGGTSADRGGFDGTGLVRVGSEPKAEGTQLAPARVFDIVGAGRTRQDVVQRLTRAATDVPHAYLTVDCRLDEMLRTRARLNEMSRGRGPGAYRLTLNDFVVKAWALALQRVPAANVIWQDGRVLRHDGSDVTVAMARDGGVSMPVIRHVHAKTLSEISIEIRALRRDAGDLAVAPPDEKGGTTTISNLGMYGINSFSSVVQAPQTTLLAVGAAERRPVVAGDHIEVGTVMSCTLACDQRAVDAADAADLLVAYKFFIEDPVRMLV